MNRLSFDPKNLSKLKLIEKTSHKGENGKVLVIGGSSLFHSASIWAAELLAHFVDLVFYYSPALLNREILLSSKKRFANGIVIATKELENYLQEADVVLLGPGMQRRQSLTEVGLHTNKTLAQIMMIKNEGVLTHVLTNKLLEKYPQKKMVIDAGALQELELKNINKNLILTPHKGEFERLFPNKKDQDFATVLAQFPATYLLKKQGVDYVFSWENPTVVTEIIGGNEGLVKGGSGDLLAALVAAFYVKNTAHLSAASASYILKKTAEKLYLTQGPYFTTTELLYAVPKIFWKLLKTQS